jgi:hypothetical protein
VEVARALMRFVEDGTPVALQCGRLVVVARLKDGSATAVPARYGLEVLDVHFATSAKSAE